MTVKTAFNAPGLIHSHRDFNHRFRRVSDSCMQITIELHSCHAFPTKIKAFNTKISNDVVL